jgi:hypothetical protein
MALQATMTKQEWNESGVNYGMRSRQTQQSLEAGRLQPPVRRHWTDNKVAPVGCRMP